MGESTQKGEGQNSEGGHPRGTRKAREKPEPPAKEKGQGAKNPTPVPDTVKVLFSQFAAGPAQTRVLTVLGPGSWIPRPCP